MQIVIIGKLRSPNTGEPLVLNDIRLGASDNLCESMWLEFWEIDAAVVWSATPNFYKGRIVVSQRDIEHAIPF